MDTFRLFVLMAAVCSKNVPQAVRGSEKKEKELHSLQKKRKTSKQMLHPQRGENGQNIFYFITYSLEISFGNLLHFFGAVSTNLLHASSTTFYNEISNAK